MNRHCERLVAILSQPITGRHADEIALVTDWLRDTIPCLKTVESDIVHEVVRLGVYKKCLRDEVVVRPGQTDDGIFIILSGVASVYVKQKHRDFASEVSAINDEPQPDATTTSTTHTHTTTAATTIHTTTSTHTTAAAITTTAVDGSTASEGFEDEPVSGTRTGLQSVPEEKKPAEDVKRSTSVVNNNKSSSDKLSREKMGKLVARFSVGKCVGGGAAQRADESFRNATVVCDDTVHLLHLSQQDYDQTLKPSRERELAFRRKFVELHPAFVCCSTKVKQLLEMTLTKQFYPSGHPIVRQGDQYDGLIFILSGQANVAVEPDKHRTQYADLLEVSTNQTEETPQTETQDNLRVAKKSRKSPGGSPSRSMGPTAVEAAARVRRRCSYMTAEKRLRSRRLNVCRVERGEIVGDVELVAGLETYCQTVTVTDPVDAYALTVKSLERIGAKALTQAMNVLRVEVETKLSNRIERLRDGVPPLFPRLVERMRFTDEERPVGLPPLVSTKTLPTNEELFQHLLKSFVENRSALCQPYVSGAVFYRDMMRTKAAQRRAAPETGGGGSPKAASAAGTTYRPTGAIIRGKGGLLGPMKPLTTRAIKVALKRQEDELEKVEETARLHEMRYMEEERTKAECERVRLDYRLSAKTPPLTEKALMTMQQILLNKIRHRSIQTGGQLPLETEMDGGLSRSKGSTADPFKILLQSPGSHSKTAPFQEIRASDSRDVEKTKLQTTFPTESAIPDLSKDSDPAAESTRNDEATNTKPDQTGEVILGPSLISTYMARRLTIVTENRQIDNDARSASIQTEGTTGESWKQMANPTGTSKGIKSVDQGVASDETEDQLNEKSSLATSGLLGSADKIGLQLERTKTLISELDRQSEPADLQTTDFDGPRERAQPREVHSARADLHLSPRGRNHHAAAAGASREQIQAETRRMKEAVVLTIAKELCEERARNRLSKDLVSTEDALYESPSYRDWETSDRSLKYLEERIARFYVQTEKETARKTPPPPPLLPKLRRFEPTDDQPRHAAPGGKVYVKCRACDVQRANGTAVKNHDHVRYHLLPSIPNYDQLRTSKMVMFQLLDDARQQWIDEH